MSGGERARSAAARRAAGAGARSRTPAPASLASPVVGSAANGARSVGASGSIRRSSRPWRPPPGKRSHSTSASMSRERREVRGHDVELGVGTGRGAIEVAVEATARGRVGRGRDDDPRAAAQQPPDELDRDRAGRGAGDERDLVAQVGRRLQPRAEGGDERGRDLGGRRDRRVGAPEARPRMRSRGRESSAATSTFGTPSGAMVTVGRTRRGAGSARPRARERRVTRAEAERPVTRVRDDARQRRGDVRAAPCARRARRDRPRSATMCSAAWRGEAVDLRAQPRHSRCGRPGRRGRR